MHEISFLRCSDQKAAMTKCLRETQKHWSKHGILKQDEQQMHLESRLAILTWLLCSHLLYIINHDKSCGRFMQLENRMIAQVKLSLNPVTLGESQCHSNWYQSKDFSHIYHYTKFKKMYMLLIDPKTTSLASQSTPVRFTKQPYKDSLPETLSQTNLAWASTSPLVMAAYTASKLIEKYAIKWAQKCLLSWVIVPLNKE